MESTSPAEEELVLPDGARTTSLRWAAWRAISATYRKLDPEWKERWCAALESGAYTQAKKHLRTPSGFCCLGVGCELSGVGTWNGSHQYITGAIEGSSTQLPPSVRAVLGLEECNPHVNYRGFAVPLAFLNDHGVSFPEIAKCIRESL